MELWYYITKKRTTIVLQEFEKWFGCLSKLYRMMIDMRKVLLFLQGSGFSRSRENVPLLENEEGLTTDQRVVTLTSIGSSMMGLHQASKLQTVDPVSYKSKPHFRRTSWNSSHSLL